MCWPSTATASKIFCRRIARNRARNFYYSFLLLSREQKDAMCAIYAFMRYCDDISEGAEPRRAQAIEQWRPRSRFEALAGNGGRKPAVARVSRHRAALPDSPSILPRNDRGRQLRLEPRQIETFDELYRYCYQVASVVGLTIIHIFGFDSPDALPLAEKCGIAFQLTNILRDIREDSENHRIYIPSEDIRKFDADLAKRDDGFLRLMRFEAERARGYYDESRPLIELVSVRSRPSLWALIEIYRRLLDRLEQSNFDVLARRIRVPTWEKLAILARAMLH
jgi:phytoene synthase